VANEPERFRLSVSDLARRRGVDKAAISRRMARYEEQGLLHPQRQAAGTKMIQAAEFGRAAALATDAVNAASVARDGVRGARDWLRAAARTLRERLASAMRLQAAAASGESDA
jgi:DNA-binding transcriptional ArsR family regulator